MQLEEALDGVVRRVPTCRDASDQRERLARRRAEALKVRQLLLTHCRSTDAVVDIVDVLDIGLEVGLLDPVADDQVEDVIQATRRTLVLELDVDVVVVVVGGGVVVVVADACVIFCQRACKGIAVVVELVVVIVDWRGRNASSRQAPDARQIGDIGVERLLEVVDKIVCRLDDVRAVVGHRAVHEAVGRRAGVDATSNDERQRRRVVPHVAERDDANKPLAQLCARRVRPTKKAKTDNRRTVMSSATNESKTAT